MKVTIFLADPHSFFLCFFVSFFISLKQYTFSLGDYNYTNASKVTLLRDATHFIKFNFLLNLRSNYMCVSSSVLSYLNTLIIEEHTPESQHQ